MSRLNIRLLSDSVRVGLWLVLFIGILLGTTLLASWFVTLVHGGDSAESSQLSAGLIVTLIILLVVAVFHLRKTSTTLTFTNRREFVHALNAVLPTMGYQVVSHTQDSLATRPTFQAILLGGGIQVAFKGAQAKCSGPKMSLEIFRSRMRAYSHIQHVQQSLSDSKCRQAERFLKRLELNVRLNTVEQLTAFQKEVAEVLANESKVVMEIKLLANSEYGIHETTLETEIRPWLEQQKIANEIHKDYIQWLNPPSCERLSLMDVKI